MSAARASPHAFLAALCLGIAAANLERTSWMGGVALGVGALLAAAVRVEDARPWLVAGALLLAGWWWGSARLDALDRASCSAASTGRALGARDHRPRTERGFELRVPAQVRRFGRLRLRESVLLELPLGRSPPQGGVLERDHGCPTAETAEARLRRAHLARDVTASTSSLRADRWRMSDGAAGSAAYADRLRAWLASSIAPGLTVSAPCGARGYRPRRRAGALAASSATAFAPPASTTCSPSPARTWCSSPRACSGSPGWSGCRAGSAQIGALVSIGGYVLAVGAAAVRGQGRDRRCARIDGVARRAAGGPLVLPARSAPRPARVEPVHVCSMPASSSRSQRSRAIFVARSARCPRARGLSVADEARRRARRLDRLRACDRAGALVPVPRGSALPCPRTPSRRRPSRLCSGSDSRPRWRSPLPARGDSTGLAQRLVRGVPRGVRAPRRRAFREPRCARVEGCSLCSR